MRTAKTIVASFVAFAALTALAFEYLLPLAVERVVQDRLGPSARFEVGDVALDRVELLNVSIAEGLDLGDVTIKSGPWQLWRGKHADVVLSQPRVDARALALAKPAGATPRVGTIAIVDGRWADELVVNGTIDLRGRVDLVAHAATMHVGHAIVRDVAATVRGPLEDLKACATGKLDGGVVLDACVAGDARARQHANLVFSAHDETWSANGTARLARTSGAFAIEDGRIDAIVDEHTVRGVTVERAALHAEIAGDLARFTVRGDLRAGTLGSDKVTLREAKLPFALRGSFVDELRLHADDELVLTATSATVSASGHRVYIDAPVVTGRGSIAMLDVVTAEPFRLVARLRGVPVDHLLAAASRDRVRGTGVLDGELVFDAKLALVGGGLAARTPGRLRIAALVQSGDLKYAVHKRVAAALSDFDYAKLALSVAREPDLRLSLHGKGHQVPQELAIDVNVRGLLAHDERTP